MAVESYTLHTSGVQECDVMSPNSVSIYKDRGDNNSGRQSNAAVHTHSRVVQMDVGFFGRG